MIFHHLNMKYKVKALVYVICVYVLSFHTQNKFNKQSFHLSGCLQIYHRRRTLLLVSNVTCIQRIKEKNVVSN